MTRRRVVMWCPDWSSDGDSNHDARTFAPILDAVVALVPTTELLRPGLLVADAHAPARVFGGEQRLAHRLHTAIGAARDLVAPGEVPAATEPPVAVELHTPGELPTGNATTPVVTRSRIGIADGWFAALLAARRAIPTSIVPPGTDAVFLAPLPVRCLIEALQAGQGTDVATSARTTGRHRAGGEPLAEFVGVLERLGIRTLGQLAALPAARVLERFGLPGARAHALATGGDRRGIVPGARDDELAVDTELDPPVARVDTATFAARGLAVRLVAELERRAWLCLAVSITARTEHGEELTRSWRSGEGFGVAELTDRVRWQLEGWLHGTDVQHRPTAGIDLLRMVVTEAVDGGRQLTVFGAASDDDRRAERTLNRLTGLLGPDAVRVAVSANGRDPSSWAVERSWVSRDTAPSHARTKAGSVAERPPWPGRIPSPAPSIVPPSPVGASLVDAEGVTVEVSARGTLSRPPCRLWVDGEPWREVAAFSAPWPADERWWNETGDRRARMQLTTVDGAGWLFAVRRGQWWMEACYD